MPVSPLPGSSDGAGVDLFSSSLEYSFQKSSDSSGFSSTTSVALPPSVSVVLASTSGLFSMPVSPLLVLDKQLTRVSSFFPPPNILSKSSILQVLLPLLSTTSVGLGVSAHPLPDYFRCLFLRFLVPRMGQRLTPSFLLSFHLRIFLSKNPPFLRVFFPTSVALPPSVSGSLAHPLPDYFLSRFSASDSPDGADGLSKNVSSWLLVSPV